MHPNLCITELKQGHSGQILSLGADPEWKRRLQCLGLRTGSLVEIFEPGNPHRPLVVICGNNRLVVDHALAENIIVKFIGSDSEVTHG